MAYDKEKLHKKIMQVAKDKKCYFIEQAAVFSGISKQTLYDYFPIGSDEMDAIKEILTANRVETKSSMYSKWYNSDNPTLQMGLMKLIGTEDEAHRLNGSRTEQNVNLKSTIFDEYDKDKIEKLKDEVKKAVED